MSEPADPSIATNTGGSTRATLGLAVASALLAGAATAWVATRAGGEAAAEGRFLAGVATSVLALLAPAMVRSRHSAAPVVWCVALLLAVVTQVAITDGPLRAGTLGALLAITIAAAWLDLIEGEPVDASGASGVAPSARSERFLLELMRLLPLCVATQVLARATVLVEQGGSAWARSLLELVGLPAGAALAFAALQTLRRETADEPGSWVPLLAVVVAAGRFHASLVATLLVFALVPRWLGGGLARAPRLFLTVPLAAVLLLRPAAGVVAVAGVTALRLRRSWPAVLLVASGLLLWLEPSRSWLDTTTGLWLLAALVPATIATGLSRVAAPAEARPTTSSGASPEGELDEAAALSRTSPPTPRFWLGAALALALVSSRVLEPRAALVAPVLLLGLGVKVVESRLRFAQSGWLSVLLAFGLAAQALPWLRAPGLEDLLVALGWRADASILALAAVLVMLFLLAAGLLARGRGTVGASVALALPAVLALLVLLPAARDGRSVTAPLEWPPRTLTAAEPVFVTKSHSVSWPQELVIDTALAHAGTLPAGTPVARVRLGREGSGAVLFEHALLIGSETGEWAAGSPALRDAPAPVPHVVAIGERGRFFAKRYRTVIELPSAPSSHEMTKESASHRQRPPGESSSTEAALEISLERDAGLPPAVTLTLFGVRLRGHAPRSEAPRP